MSDSVYRLHKRCVWSGKLFFARTFLIPEFYCIHFSLKLCGEKKKKKRNCIWFHLFFLSLSFGCVTKRSFVHFFLLQIFLPFFPPPSSPQVFIYNTYLNGKLCNWIIIFMTKKYIFTHFFPADSIDNRVWPSHSTKQVNVQFLWRKILFFSPPFRILAPLLLSSWCSSSIPAWHWSTKREKKS